MQLNPALLPIDIMLKAQGKQENDFTEPMDRRNHIGSAGGLILFRAGFEFIGSSLPRIEQFTSRICIFTGKNLNFTIF